MYNIDMETLEETHFLKYVGQKTRKVNYPVCI